MSVPKPVPGLVVHYSFLWHYHHLQGFEEGFKDRPCAVVLVVEEEVGTQVTVLGITHTHPSHPDDAVQIPMSLKKRIGLDTRPSWIVVTETNTFGWPGPDLRPRDPDDSATIAYGLLPEGVVVELRRRLRQHALAGRIRAVKRTV